VSRVVDTSVAIKWLVAESGSDEATRLIGSDMIAPDLLLAEVGSTAWKKWRRNEIGAEHAASMPANVALFVRLVESRPLADTALAIALELAHPVYDRYFLAVAELSGRRLVTADRRLAEACRGTRFEPPVEPLE